MSNRDPIRPVIRDLMPSGISQVTALGLGHPDVLPLWFGETDLVTPPFIRHATIAALEDGRTFYTNARGIPQLRIGVKSAPVFQGGDRGPANEGRRHQIGLAEPQRQDVGIAQPQGGHLADAGGHEIADRRTDGVFRGHGGD